MKLLTRTSTYFMLTAIPLFIGAIFLCYFFIKQELDEKTNEVLWNQKLRVEKIIGSYRTIESGYLGIDSIISFTRIPADPGYKYRYYDTLLNYLEEDEPVPHRMLKSVYRRNHSFYLITTGKNTLDSGELFEGIITSLSLLFVLMACILVVMNYVVSRSIWKPFNASLEKIRSFNLRSLQTPQFDAVPIAEFNALNRTLKQMTEKMVQDYISLKQFTENASHELQTPLAGIKTNLDLLIQSQKLGEQEMKVIHRIYQAVDKLSHLNKSLVLLSKIENNQFTEEQEISVNEMLPHLIMNYSDQLEQKKVKLNLLFDKPLVIRMHPMLAEVLFGNLLQNAIKHNISGGKITIESVNKNTVKIGNTGRPLKTDKTEKLFERFRKDDDSSTSIGLGLAIIQQICDLYNITIRYRVQDSWHELELSWKFLSGFDDNKGNY